MTAAIALSNTVLAFPGTLSTTAGIENIGSEHEVATSAQTEELCGADPDLWLYRDRTIGMLRRYYRPSIEVGRLPSLLGREFFRTRITSYTVSTFEDAVIFVHDVERVLDRLDTFDKKLIGKIVLQDYTQDEAARLLNCGRRTVVRRFPEAVDRITESFLEGGLLTRLPVTSSAAPESCQEANPDEKELSDCEERE
jgi:predicted DNA-binding protein (UPF0251 family)